MASAEHDSSASLLGLPVELRLFVYGYIFQDLATPLRNLFDPLPKYSRLFQLSDLFLTSRQIHYEARSLYEKKWLGCTTLYFSDLNRLLETSELAHQVHPQLAPMRFHLRAEEYMKDLDQVARHFMCESLLQDEARVSRPAQEVHYGPTGATWAWLLVRPQGLPLDWHRVVTLPTPEDPALQGLTLALPNGCRISAYSQNIAMESAMPFFCNKHQQLGIVLEGHICDLDTCEVSAEAADAMAARHYESFWFCFRQELIQMERTLEIERLGYDRFGEAALTDDSDAD